MKKTTSIKLSKKLAQYGALSMAIAGVTDLNGQIIYTDIMPDFDQGTGQPYSLDLNNDGTPDFQIHIESASDLKIMPLNANNEVLGNPYSSSSSFYVFPYALSNGAPISNSASGSWFNNSFSVGVQDLNYSSCLRGNWCSVTDKYLGLRFNISGNIYYGWARLDVGASGNTWLVKDFANHKTPDAPIMAGQTTTLGIGDNHLNNVKIVALNKSIALFNLPQQTDYRLFSITGQSVLDGNIENNIHVIEANTLATGVYIVELKDKDTNAVIRKKIVL